VVSDGEVGRLAVLVARFLGAERIIATRHASGYRGRRCPKAAAPWMRAAR